MNLYLSSGKTKNMSACEGDKPSDEASGRFVPLLFAIVMDC